MRIVFAHMDPSISACSILSCKTLELHLENRTNNNRQVNIRSSCAIVYQDSTMLSCHCSIFLPAHTLKKVQLVMSLQSKMRFRSWSTYASMYVHLCIDVCILVVAYARGGTVKPSGSVIHIWLDTCQDSSLTSILIVLSHVCCSRYQYCFNHPRCCRPTVQDIYIHNIVIIVILTGWRGAIDMAMFVGRKRSRPTNPWSRGYSRQMKQTPLMFKNRCKYQQAIPNSSGKIRLLASYAISVVTLYTRLKGLCRI